MKHDHKIRSYIHFMVYLKSKKSDQISGVELYVRELFVKQKSTEWYPILNTVFLEGTEESTEDKVVAKLKSLEDSLEKIDSRLKSEIKNMCTKFNIQLRKKRDKQDMDDSDDDDDETNQQQLNSVDDISDKEAFEEFYEECKDKDFEVLPNYLARQGSGSPDDEKAPLKNRKKLARDLWKWKKEGLGKELQALDIWRDKLTKRIKDEELALQAEHQSQQPQELSVAEKSKKDPVSKSVTPSGVLSSVLGRVDLLTRIQAR